jgi:phage tail sheath protein FI
VADPEFVEANMLSVPGVTQPAVTDHVIAIASDRADCLGVIDIEGIYTPASETTSVFKDRLGSVKEAVDGLANRRINTSYACTYYPWVRIRDDISNSSLWVPPSVIAIGTFASSEARAELWFAPAGFTRGGLSTGAGGWPVLSTTERLRRVDRDDLYAANINPIATFPSEGIVIFGQKTLQVTPSALDRINVRRLMIFLKKRISRIAASILFDQNVRTTWTRFKSEADKFLASVQTRLGLTEFRVVLDETTTTPDLVDRNILYAKIFLKPARAIEFIAIDFVITRTGASFDD